MLLCQVNVGYQNRNRHEMMGRKTIIFTPTGSNANKFGTMGFAPLDPSCFAPFKAVKSPSTSPVNRNYRQASPRSSAIPVGTIVRGGSPKSSMGSPPSSGLLVDGHYAGAKFSDPPNPTTLPKPPSHWMGDKIVKKKVVFGNSDASIKAADDYKYPEKNCTAMTNHLKLLLNVQA